MARPTNKEELESLSVKNYDKLINYVNSFTEEVQEKEFLAGTMNRNIRDVLSHLYHWHLLMLDWYKVGMSGVKPAMPAEGYTWKTTKELNYKIWEQYQNMSLKEAIKKFKTSHELVLELIKNHTNEELFTKKKYKWTGTTSLGAYLISSTSSHYDWAYKLIKKQLKN